MNRYEYKCECGHKWMGLDDGDSFCEICGKYSEDCKRLNKGDIFGECKCAACNVDKI